MLPDKMEIDGTATVGCKSAVRAACQAAGCDGPQPGLRTDG